MEVLQDSIVRQNVEPAVPGSNLLTVKKQHFDTLNNFVNISGWKVVQILQYIPPNFKFYCLNFLF